jgi:hypothetical protein
MPDLPTLPPTLLDAVGWVKWSPLPVAAGLAFFLFAVSVWVLWSVISAILRWAKLVG